MVYSKYLESAWHITGTQIIPEWMIATIFFLNVDQVHPVKSDQDMVKGPVTTWAMRTAAGVWVQKAGLELGCRENPALSPAYKPKTYQPCVWASHWHLHLSAFETELLQGWNERERCLAKSKELTKNKFVLFLCFASFNSWGEKDLEMITFFRYVNGNV